MRRVVLAGCGHAHLEVVRGAAAFAARGAELVLIDPGLFWYSGRGSGLLGGRFTEDEATIDPARLAAACGAAFVQDAVSGVDRASRQVVLRSGERLAYDLLSLNIGSRVPAPEGVVAQAVKPIGAIPALRRVILAASAPVRIVVVGGGATGCEIAGNLLFLKQGDSSGIAVTLVSADPHLVAQAPRGLRERAFQSLTRRGARVLLSSEVASADETHIRLTSGETVAFDLLILATGLAADPLVGVLGLPVRDAGLRVDAMLRSLGDVRVFAAGDCAAIEGFDLPKVGVHGVRAGPVLLRNLLAALDGRALEAFSPQKHFLSILDLADGEGLAMRAGLWTSGRLPLRWKNRLDQTFLDRYRRLYRAG